MDTKKLVRTGLLLALALVFQIGFRQFAQPLVGPLVNMTLLIAALLVGPISGSIIGILTPIVALILGIIALPPLVPIIAIGNSLLVITFYYTNKKFNKWVGLILSAIIKFGFLAIAVRIVLPLFLSKVPPVVISAFTLPQLYTALIGGIVAILVYSLIQKNI